MKNKDPQYIEAKRILDDIPFGVTQLFKTTRNGATTGLIANSIDAGLKVMLIADTNKIAIKTLNDALKYTNWGVSNVKNIPGKSGCSYNKLKIEKNPILGELSHLPTPDCRVCKRFNNCQVTDFLVCDDWDAVSLTHAKLNVLINSSEDSLNGLILNRLVKEVDIILIDEVDKIMSNLGSSIMVYPYPDLNKYKMLLDSGKYKDASMYIKIFGNIINYYKDQISGLIKYNTAYDGEKLMTYPLLNIEHLLFNKDANMCIDDINYYSKISGDLIGLIMKRSLYDLNVDDIKYIETINEVLSGFKLGLQYLNTTDKGEIVNLISNNGLTKSFKVFTKMFNNKKIILTSATMGNLKYENIFGKVNKMIMTDVCNTNEIMTYIPDTYNISMYDYWRVNEDIPSKNHRNRILASIYKYSEDYPDIIFVTMTQRSAFNLTKWIKEDYGVDIKIDYYGSDNMRGVACNNRKMCCIGMPVKPKNTYDSISENPEESIKTRISEDHSQLRQATGRVKDPMGIEPSYVYSIGINENTLTMALIDGEDREIELKQITTWSSDKNRFLFGNKCANVTVSNSLGMPNIIPADAIKLVKYINKNPDITRKNLLNGRKIKANRLDELLKLDYVKDRVEIIKVKGNIKLITTYRSKGGL